MTEYSTEKTKNKLIISFYYDYHRLVLPSFISLVIFGMLIYAIQFLELNITNVVYSLIIILIILYVNFNSYFEWRKNRQSELEILDEKLYINRKLFLQKNHVKNIFIEYCSSRYETGWRIYLENYLGNKRHTIKEQLSEKDAKDIANIISEFLNVTVHKNN